MKFKIGQTVKSKKTGREYEVIGDKNTEYNSPDSIEPWMQNLKPNLGQDYLLKVKKVEKDFEPFESVFEDDIE